MSLKTQIPNAITLLNLLSGCIAVYFACNNRLEIAALFTILGIFFDFFDGFFARLFNANSELGLQLDSLADMVTSGIVPGAFMFQLLLSSLAVNDYLPTKNIGYNFLEWVAFLGFFITLSSCYRLANFNIDTKQTNSFIGLPTPANTLLIMSIGLIKIYQPESIFALLLHNVWFLLFIIVVSCYLLNCNISLFALKFKDWSFKNNWIRYLFILIAILFISFFRYFGITLSILLYVALSLISTRSKK